MLKKFLKDQSGASGVEYGLIASLVVLGALAAIRATGNGVDEKWHHVSSTFVNAVQ